MQVKLLVAGLLASLCFCVSTPANETAAVKCPAGAKQVPLYASLGNSQTAAQLACGDRVEIVGHDRGFARVRTNQGTEGYVAANALERAVDPADAPQAGTVEAVNADPPDLADYTTMNTHCSTYFSAYGVSPAQLSWIANDARKQYPGICPAAAPRMVDYVIIFTHDVDFYPSAMPEPLYRDGKGLSDWTPLTTEDTALVPVSKLDRARREYVWVFRMARGSFHPDTFSSKSRAQFAKSESRDAERTAVDAFRFIAGAAPRPPAPSVGQ